MENSNISHQKQLDLPRTHGSSDLKSLTTDIKLGAGCTTVIPATLEPKASQVLGQPGQQSETSPCHLKKKTKNRYQI
jgi:hypothetical protein